MKITHQASVLICNMSWRSVQFSSNTVTNPSLTVLVKDQLRKHRFDVKYRSRTMRVLFLYEFTIESHVHFWKKSKNSFIWSKSDFSKYWRVVVSSNRRMMCLWVFKVHHLIVILFLIENRVETHIKLCCNSKN